MDRQFYLDYAAKKPVMPIAADLVLHEQDDVESTHLCGVRLGEVMAEAARRYDSPLALSLMDLTMEVEDLAGALGREYDPSSHFQFDETPAAEMLAAVRGNLDRPFGPRHIAQHEALQWVAQHTDLTTVGMVIGPFFLMTKLIADPITPVALAGMGHSSEDDADVCCVERTLQLAEMIIVRSLLAQVSAGAEAICMCEPAANKIYLSPNQIESGSDIFERYVMQPNMRLRSLLKTLDVDLIFHNCGELTDMMVKQFAERLDPAILSLGSSRTLWEDTALVPNDVVLFGNLPSKHFFNDNQINLTQVSEQANELAEKMAATGHPFILGTECDVLHVEGCEQTIRAKVDAMCQCGCVMD